MKKETVRVYAPDKSFIKEKADAEGVSQADVIAEAIEAYGDVTHHHRCPECGCRFELEEVDVETVRESGVVHTDVRYFLRGKTQVKDFECPSCNARITPQDAEMQEPVSTEDVSDPDTESRESEDAEETE
jgi:predicted RNA-binding Zn-ribbon protein involved in translation (DUF1610 family)